MPKTIADGVVLVWAGAVMVYLLILAGSLAYHRKKPFLAARGARFLVVMCLAAVLHIVTAIVGHQHADSLEDVERMSCVLWGYWLPYAAVGIWFSSQYLQVMTYIAMLSYSLTWIGTRRVLFVRPFVAVFILAPPVLISIATTASPTAARIDPVTGECTSALAAKMAIAVWLLLCVAGLAVSLSLFRRTLSRDAMREMPRQWAVLIVSVGAAATQAYVVVVASTGFDDVANRVLATASISTMYAAAMSVLASRPLWKVLTSDQRYARMQETQLAETQQTVVSILRLMECAKPSRDTRLIVADFLLACSDPKCSRMDRGSEGITHPMRIVAFYAAMDTWVQRNLGDAYNHEQIPYGRRDRDGFPPLISTDITRTARDIMRQNFPARFGGDGSCDSDAVGPLNVPHDLAEAAQSIIASTSIANEPEVSIFRELMWWCIEILDAFFGKDYLNAWILQRPIYVHEQGVRMAIIHVRQQEAASRLAEGGVKVEPATGPGLGLGPSPDTDSDPEPDAEDCAIELESAGDEI